MRLILCNNKSPWVDSVDKETSQFTPKFCLLSERKIHVNAPSPSGEVQNDVNVTVENLNCNEYSKGWLFIDTSLANQEYFYKDGKLTNVKHQTAY